jgi:hypothetical protein
MQREKGSTLRLKEASLYEACLPFAFNSSNAASAFASYTDDGPSHLCRFFLNILER